MTSLKEKIINGIIDIEGGYVNNPDDSGGETNWGITDRVAREAGFRGAIKDLPRSVAYDIYVRKYWDALHLDAIESMSKAVAEEMADTAVNMGVRRSAKFLQRSLNTLNSKATTYPDMAVDSQIGPATLRALGDYLGHRGQYGGIVLVRMLNSLQGAFYIELAERREKDESFIFGWFKHRVVI